MLFRSKSTDGGFTYGGENVTVEEATSCYMGKLASVFPVTAKADGTVPDYDYVGGAKYTNISTKVAKPRVFIPAFPGTNCELDTARAFRLAGAEPEILVIKNRTAADIEESVQAIISAIDKSNIIAFPGGFSGGDEPDGSGKFIAKIGRAHV